MRCSNCDAQDFKAVEDRQLACRVCGTIADEPPAVTALISRKEAGEGIILVGSSARILGCVGQILEYCPDGTRVFRLSKEQVVKAVANLEEGDSLKDEKAGFPCRPPRCGSSS